MVKTKAKEKCMFYVKKVIGKRPLKTHEIKAKVEKISNVEYDYKTIYNRLHDLWKSGKVNCFHNDNECKRGNIRWNKI